MWWWGPCAGASCCSDAVLPRSRRAAALYDELVPLLTDRRTSSYESTSNDTDLNDDKESLQRRGFDEFVPGIYRARDVRTHDAVALKVFDKAILKNQDSRRRIRQEIKVLSLCRDHPNILRLYGVYSSRRTFEIAFELARGGEVMHRIVRASSLDPLLFGQPQYRVSEREISRVIASAASAIEYMHQRGIIHGEIRPEHLLYSDLEPDARVVLVDFGRATAWKDLTFRSRIHRHKFEWHDLHSVKFLPPAVLQRRPEDGVPDWEHARQVDVWSLGVSMFVLLCGAFPFDGQTIEEIRESIVQAPLMLPTRHSEEADPHDVVVSRAARDLLAKLLEKDPYQSPSIDDVCEHPWLKEHVAADVRWSDTRINDFSVFAEHYAREVAESSLRRRTVVKGDFGLTSHSCEYGDEVPYNVYGVDCHSKMGPVGSSRVMDEFDPEAERPSFVSTDGNIQVGDVEEERLSADAYMRLASVELEALSASKAQTLSPSPRQYLDNSTNALSPHRLQRKSRRSANVSSQQDNHDEWTESGARPVLRSARPSQTAEIDGDFWPVYTKQRRFFSFKSLSFVSTSSGSKEE